MLNELLVVERGIRDAGIETAQRHPDVQDCGKTPTLVVRLNEEGQIGSIMPLPETAKPWRFCDGKQNAFPFVKPSRPILLKGNNGNRLLEVSETKNDIASALTKLRGETGTMEPLVMRGLPQRLKERRKDMTPLEGTEGAVVPTTIDRFLLAIDSGKEGQVRFFDSLVDRMVSELLETEEASKFARSLLVGKFNKKEKKWECKGAILFESEGLPPIYSPGLDVLVSKALSKETAVGQDIKQGGRCALTGLKQNLISGNFPQPTIRVLGQTFIFSKNKDIEASYRYDRYASEALPVGQDVAERLAAAFKAATSDERRGITWQSIPRESTEGSDLLLAFVEAAPDMAVVGSLAATGEEDFSEEEQEDANPSTSVAQYERRTERLLDALGGKTQQDFRLSPIQIAVFRSVDTGNRKVVYTSNATIENFYLSAKDWAAGERNHPPRLTLPVFVKGKKQPVEMGPRHMNPLDMVGFSKFQYMRAGTKSQATSGLPASEVLELFLDIGNLLGRRRQARAERFLRFTLKKRTPLVACIAHARRRGRDGLKAVDIKGELRRETLRTVNVFGILLHKLGRAKEDYMQSAGFKLGQLLAAADTLHAGYCAAVRGGDMPPSLLGNQVFNIAQTSPTKALAVLARRWKPYIGWAAKADRDKARFSKMTESKDPKESGRGWDILRALSQCGRMPDLAVELESSLGERRPDDLFRAELLLGYIAGLPKKTTNTNDQASNSNE